jgi:monomeric sarcosine oxidase
MANTIYDVAVVGAGVFGAWTAWHLQQAGQRVVLLDAYGAGNSRASSGGESRIIRMGYGGEEIYTRWSRRALMLWQEFCARTGQPLLHRTGVLWMARQDDPYSLQTERTLQTVGVHCEKLTRRELETRYPQVAFGPVTLALFEPDSGVLMARRAVQAVVHDARQSGLQYLLEAVAPPPEHGHLEGVSTRSGTAIKAGYFVFACGPWLPKIFPQLLGNRLYPTRQEVYFFGIPAGDTRFAPPAMPAWIDFGAEIYGIPDLEQRGFKVALDRHGPPCDPDTDERLPTPALLATVREYLAQRFPALQHAPLLEARVCQYENTSQGDFLIDCHPDFDNVWLVGGGSGHGFKHGPALGEYVAARILNGGDLETRFTLATKATMQQRAVF